MSARPGSERQRGGKVRHAASQTLAAEPFKPSLCNGSPKQRTSCARYQLAHPLYLRLCVFIKNNLRLSIERSKPPLRTTFLALGAVK